MGGEVDRRADAEAAVHGGERHHGHRIGRRSRGLAADDAADMDEPGIGRQQERAAPLIEADCLQAEVDDPWREGLLEKLVRLVDAESWAEFAHPSPENVLRKLANMMDFCYIYTNGHVSMEEMRCTAKA